MTPYEMDFETALLEHFEGRPGGDVMGFRHVEGRDPHDRSALPGAAPRARYGPGPGGLGLAPYIAPPLDPALGGAPLPRGSATYIAFPASDPLSRPQGTLEIWVRVAGLPATLVQQGPYFGSPDGWTFGLGAEIDGRVESSAWNGFTLRSGPGRLKPGRSTHVAVSWGNRGARLYVDRTEAARDINTGAPASGFGGRLLVPAGSASGESAVDELRVSDVQREASELLSGRFAPRSR